MNFFKLYIGDYQRDTAHLSVTEHGAYMLMLQHYYATEKPLPTGKALHRMLRAQDKAEREAIDAVVAQFWTVTEAGLVNERADVEIAKAAAQGETNARIAREREAARKAAREQHERSTNRATNGQPNQTPDTRHHSVAELPQGGESAQPPAVAKAPAPSRGSRLPKDWTPGDEQRAFAATLGMVNGRFDAEVAKFRDYWVAQPGQKGVKADWTATLRNWLRRAAEEGRGKPPAGGSDFLDGVH